MPAFHAPMIDTSDLVQAAAFFRRTKKCYPTLGLGVILENARSMVQVNEVIALHIVSQELADEAPKGIALE